MKKYTTIILFVAGCGLIFLGWKVGSRSLMSLGALPIGVSAFMWGVDAVRTRTSDYDSSTTHEGYYPAFSYRGLAAVGDGVSLILWGVLIIAGGLLFLFHLEHSFIHGIKERPGLVLIFSGFLMASSSLTLILGAREENRVSGRMLVSIPRRLFGLLLFLTACGALLSGLYELVNPSGFDSLLASFTRQEL